MITEEMPPARFNFLTRFTLYKFLLLLKIIVSRVFLYFARSVFTIPRPPNAITSSIWLIMGKISLPPSASRMRPSSERIHAPLSTISCGEKPLSSKKDGSDVKSNEAPSPNFFTVLGESFLPERYSRYFSALPE